MARFNCLHHRPTHPHYRSYARPLAYLEQPCTEPTSTCRGRALVWLNPEEVKDYERGSRLFYDADLNALRVDGGGLTCVRPRFVRWPRVGAQLSARRLGEQLATASYSYRATPHRTGQERFERKSGD